MQIARSIPGACLDFHAVFVQTKLSEGTYEREGRPRSRINFFAVEARDVTFQQVVEFLARRSESNFQGLQTATPISLRGRCSINSRRNIDAANKERERDYPSWNESSTRID